MCNWSSLCVFPLGEPGQPGLPGYSSGLSHTLPFSVPIALVIQLKTGGEILAPLDLMPVRSGSLQAVPACMVLTLFPDVLVGQVWILVCRDLRAHLDPKETKVGEKQTVLSSPSARHEPAGMHHQDSHRDWWAGRLAPPGARGLVQGGAIAQSPSGFHYTSGLVSALSASQGLEKTGRFSPSTPTSTIRHHSWD